MNIGKKSRSTIEGLLVLAKKPFAATLQQRDIVKAARVPADFLAKIFQKLNRVNLVISSGGAVRAYALAHRPNVIKMRDGFVAIDGNDVFERCIFWSDRCADLSPCPMHFEWEKMRQAIVALMQRTTLAELARKSRQ